MIIYLTILLTNEIITYCNIGVYVCISCVCVYTYMCVYIHMCLSQHDDTNKDLLSVVDCFFCVYRLTLVYMTVLINHYEC